MPPKYTIHKRKYIYDIFTALFTSILISGFIMSSLMTEIDVDSYEIDDLGFLIVIISFFSVLIGQLILYWMILKRHMFSDQGDSFFIEKGLFFKRKVNIPYKNVHSVSLKRRFFDMLFGLSILEIDTGTTTTFQSEGRLILSKNYAHQLKNYLEAKKHDPNLSLPSPNNQDDVEIDDTPQNTLKWYKLFQVGFLREGLLLSVVLMLVFIVGVGSIAVILSEDIVFNEYFLVLIFIYLVSVISTFIGSGLLHVIIYYKYSYQITDSHVTYAYGLFYRYTFKIPIYRINAIKLNQSLLYRLFKVYQMNISVIGVGDINPDNNKVAESKSILLMAKINEVNTVLSALNHKCINKIDEIVPNKFRMLNFMILPLSVLVVLNVLLYVFIYSMFAEIAFVVVFIQILLLVLAFIGFYLKMVQQKIEIMDHTYIFNKGSFTKRQIIVKKNKIQIASYRQNPILLIENMGHIYFKYKDIRGHVWIKNQEYKDFEKIIEGLPNEN